MSVRRLCVRAITLSALLGAGVAFGSAADDGVTIDFNKTITLSPQETLTQSKDYYKKMQETQRRVTMLQAKAKKDRDMVKLNCVNDKLIRLKGHQTVAEQSMAAASVAAARSDEGARQHEISRLVILYQKVTVLGTEAENCIGEDVSYVGATKVDIDIDPSIPDDDPTQPALPLPDPTRPAEATPFA